MIATHIKMGALLGFLALSCHAVVQPRVPRTSSESLDARAIQTPKHTPVASAISQAGNSLEFTVDQLSPEDYNSTQALDPRTYHRTGQFTHDGEALFKYTMTVSNGVLVTTVDWSGELQGPRFAALRTNIADNSTTGDIDGRLLNSFKISTSLDASRITFQDGKPPVPLRAPPNILRSDVEKLVKSIKLDLSSDPVGVGPAAADAPLGGVRLTPRTDRSVDRGHISDTYGALSCKGCKAAVGIAEVAALAACTAACIVTFGIGCAPCFAGAGLAAVAGLEGCQHSSSCCPLGCNLGGDLIHPGRCCFGGETCLDGAAGKCCASGKQACMGKSCCSFEQTCVTSGPSKGTCCPEGVAICGGQCCPGDTDVCAGGGCCPRQKKCGTACCRDSGGPFVFRYYCADASRNLCCQEGEVETNGICCARGMRNCGGKCCGGQCGPNGTCRPSDAECKRDWDPRSAACTTHAQCTAPNFKCMFDAGCCAEVPR